MIDPEIRPRYMLRLFLAVLISTFIFVNIFFLAHTISYLNYIGIRQQNNLISFYVNEIDNTLKEGNCSKSLLIEASSDLDYVGSKLGLLEQRFGKDDFRVLEQKNYYVSLELKHYELVRKLNKECNGNFSIILFFYSNSKEKQDESEKMGFILGSFKRRHIIDVMIYSFDYNLENKEIDALEKKYKIKEVPISLIDEKNLLYVRNIDDLEHGIFNHNK